MLPTDILIFVFDMISDTEKATTIKFLNKTFYERYECYHTMSYKERLGWMVDKFTDRLDTYFERKTNTSLNGWKILVKNYRGFMYTCTWHERTNKIRSETLYLNGKLLCQKSDSFYVLKVERSDPLVPFINRLIPNM